MALERERMRSMTMAEAVAALDRHGRVNAPEEKLSTDSHEMASSQVGVATATPER